LLPRGGRAVRGLARPRLSEKAGQRVSVTFVRVRGRSGSRPRASAVRAKSG
jgi:hypothetical protein